MYTHSFVYCLFFVLICAELTKPIDSSATEVPMPGVKGDILAKVIEFMNHHKVNKTNQPNTNIKYLSETYSIKRHCLIRYLIQF